MSRILKSLSDTYEPKNWHLALGENQRDTLILPREAFDAMVETTKTNGESIGEWNGIEHNGVFYMLETDTLDYALRMDAYTCGFYCGIRMNNPYESIFEIDGAAESAFTRDVVAFVDSVYRTVPKRSHRAVAGLSIGGYQSLYLGANHPDVFGYIGSMSPYMWGLGKPVPYRWRFYSGLYRKLRRQYREYPPYGFYLYAAKNDMMRPATQKLHNRMNQKGYPHSYAVYPGSHDWPQGWAQEFKDMFEKVFKDENPLCNQ